MSQKLIILFAVAFMAASQGITWSSSVYDFTGVRVPETSANVNGDGAVTCFDMGAGSAGQLEPGYPARGTPGLHVVFDH